jgi:hypothetical protein
MFKPGRTRGAQASIDASAEQVSAVCSDVGLQPGDDTSGRLCKRCDRRGSSSAAIAIAAAGAGVVGFGGAAARGMHYLAAMRNITEQGEATRPCLAVRDSGGGVGAAAAWGAAAAATVFSRAAGHGGGRGGGARRRRRGGGGGQWWRPCGDTWAA